MKIMFMVCVAILIFAIFTYDKWSYKAWYKRCVKRGTGYDWNGNYYDHNKGLFYNNKTGCVENINYQNLNKNRRKHKMRSK